MRVAVSDNGPGIPVGRHGIIFAPFLEAGDTPESAPHGAGFSLALSKAIVERHDGRIGVESRPGEGATFDVSLPTVPRPPRGRRPRVTPRGSPRESIFCAVHNNHHAVTALNCSAKV